MTNAEIVSKLVFEIRWRFYDVAAEDIEKKLVSEGWSIGAIREAIKRLA